MEVSDRRYEAAGSDTIRIDQPASRLGLSTGFKGRCVTRIPPGGTFDFSYLSKYLASSVTVGLRIKDRDGDERSARHFRTVSEERRGLNMLLESIEYTRPATVDEALEALDSGEGAAALAGGQSLTNVLKNRVASIDLLVDISRLEELRGIEVGDDSVEIGACVTYDEIDRSPEIRSALPILSEVGRHIEDQQIRSRGTIGGNCCLSDPTNNFPPLVIALGGTMHVQSRSGTRDIPADEFFQGYFMTAIEPGEILRGISIPRLGPETGAG